jgi:hypothetical protein
MHKCSCRTPTWPCLPHPTPTHPTHISTIDLPLLPPTGPTQLAAVSVQHDQLAPCALDDYPEENTAGLGGGQPCAWAAGQALEPAADIMAGQALQQLLQGQQQLQALSRPAFPQLQLQHVTSACTAATAASCTASQEPANDPSKAVPQQAAPAMAAAGPGQALTQALLQANCPAGVPLHQLASLQLSMERLASAAGLAGLCPDLLCLHLDSNQLQTLDGIEGLVELQELSLRGNQLRSMRQLAAMGKLRRLHLDHNCLTRVEGLGRCSQLHTLTLGSNGITGLEPAALQGCSDSLQVGSRGIPAGCMDLQACVQISWVCTRW